MVYGVTEQLKNMKEQQVEWQNTIKEKDSIIEQLNEEIVMKDAQIIEQQNKIDNITPSQDFPQAESPKKVNEESDKGVEG